MEQTENQKRNNSKKKVASTTMPIRVKKETAKEIKKRLNQANNKSFGRRVKADDLITKGLSLLEDHHIKEVQENTLSYADKIDQKYKEICAQRGKITRDEFNKMIVEGAVTFDRPTTKLTEAKSA